VYLFEVHETEWWSEPDQKIPIFGRRPVLAGALNKNPPHAGGRHRAGAQHSVICVNIKAWARRPRLFAERKRSSTMTTEERFERIEIALTGTAEAQQRQTESLSQLTQLIGKYVESADARMTRIEENLDGLIRAITAEHGNGKKH
jgi:hypothetical protein